MSSGRHRRNPAPDEQPWLEQEFPGQPHPEHHPEPRRRHARNETTPDLPAWPDPAQPDHAWPAPPPPPQAQYEPPQPQAPSGWPADETSLDLPAWRGPVAETPPGPSAWPDFNQPPPQRSLDETSTDLPAWREPFPPEPAPRTLASDETSTDLPPWRDPSRPEPAPRRPLDQTSADLPAWRDPAPRRPRGETSLHPAAWRGAAQPEDPPQTWASGQTSTDLPAWRDSGRPEQARRTPAPDETSLDLPAFGRAAPARPAADETSVDLPAWRDPARPGRPSRARIPDETSVDLPAWDELAPRRRRPDETVVDRPAWDDQPRRARTGPPGHPGSRKTGKGDGKGKAKGPLRMMIAAAAVVVIGAGVSVYGLTTRTTVAGATYTPSTVGSKVPQTQPDPAALALRRSTPVKIQIPSIGVSAPIEQVGLLTNGEVQTPPLDVHNLTGWYKYGPTPGQNGASVILGHVDSGTGLSVFYYLKDLRRGDQISVTLADGITANFVVDGLQKASKDNFPTQQVYGKIGYPGLRLLTCGGSFDSATGHYDDNIIVYAHLVRSATT